MNKKWTHILSYVVILKWIQHMNTCFKVLDNELGGLKPFCSVRWSSLRQDEVIWNYDVVKPRLTQHLHRALLQPSNVQEVGIPKLNNQLAGWRKRMESEALRLDSSGSTVFSLFLLSMYQYFRMWDGVPRYQIGTILSQLKVKISPLANFEWN